VCCTPSRSLSITTPENAQPFPPRWIAVTDNRWARLVRCQRTEPEPAGRWHADEFETIRTTWDEHQPRHEPALPDGAPKADDPDHAPGWAHKKEEETRRFAHEVAAWLDRRSAALAIRHISVFAPDHFLGPLRLSWSPRLRPLLTEHAGELTHLRPPELLEHPTIAGILASAPTG
jgi:protein required for attachment to host cells